MNVKKVPMGKKKGPYEREKRSLYTLFFIPKGLWGLNLAKCVSRDLFRERTSVVWSCAASVGSAPSLQCPWTEKMNSTHAGHIRRLVSDTHDPPTPPNLHVLLIWCAAYLVVDICFAAIQCFRVFYRCCMKIIMHNNIIDREVDVQHSFSR